MKAPYEFAAAPNQEDFRTFAKFVAEAEEESLSPVLLEKREAVIREFSRMAEEPVTEESAARYQTMRLFVRG